MAKARTPSLAAPLKVAQQMHPAFVAKIREHAAVQADPLLQAQAVWISGILEGFKDLLEQRATAAKEQANG